MFLRVNKQPIANTVEVVDALCAALPKMFGIPEGVKLGISFDQSLYIRQSIHNLIEQTLHGSLLAAAVILIFLRNLTSTVIISVAIPLSMLVTFIVLYFTGQTLNVFTLGGLALGIGRLVDDSIVELENIQRHLNITSSRWDSIREAAREVAMPIFASTVTTVVVFLPMFFVVGIARLLLIPLTVTIAIALFTSFLVSRTVTPALCYKFFKPEQEAWRSMSSWFTKLMEWSRNRYESLDRSYEDSLRWVLGHRRIFIALVLLLFVGSLTLVPLIGTEFLPVSDEASFASPCGHRSASGSKRPNSRSQKSNECSEPIFPQRNWKQSSPVRDPVARSLVALQPQHRTPYVFDSSILGLTGQTEQNSSRDHERCAP